MKKKKACGGCNGQCHHHHQKKPSLLRRIVVPAAVMIGTELVKDPIKRFFSDFVKSNMIKEYYIDGICCDINDFLKEHFKHIPDQFMMNSSIDKAEKSYEAHQMNMLYDNDNTFTDYAIIEGVPCKLSVSCARVSGDAYSSNTSIATININGYPERLKELIKKAGIEAARKAEKKMKILKVTDQHSATFIDAFERSFDDVFVPKTIRDQLTDALDKFMNNADWYIDNKIPYHFGIMLYGSPGTGKTSIAQVIANYTKATMYVVSGDDVLKLPQFMRNGRVINEFGLTKNDFNIILIEDIDCGLSYKALYDRAATSISGVWAGGWDDPNELDKKKNMNGLATVLNAIDGIGAPRNTIFIFTTNHIEDLDPALIRPGRIDLTLEIKPICLETFTEFMTHHFGEDVKIPKNLLIKEGLTFADLQVKVMSGMSAEEIINYVKRKAK